MFWVRVDNRLIHGQIIVAWLPFTGAKRLVAANDALAADVVRQEILSLAVPGGVEAVFSPVAETAGLFTGNGGKKTVDALVVLADLPDARRAYEAGLPIKILNVGNLHYAPGKRQVAAHIAVNEEDEGILKQFEARGVELDFRALPGESAELKSLWTGERL